ncbi:MAG: glycosyltransferase family 39 protein [Pedobacter sp.]|nr:MAG: glycosyltransferase family 39 protein [Pedobacter sp.]
MTKRSVLLVGFITLKFLLQYVLISPEYDLHRDEYLHLDQAHHLAWGYTSVPPFTSWISTIIYWLGNSVFWVKFFPALFGALTILVVWQSIKALGGNIYALILGATGVLFSVLLRLNTLYQPNTFDVLSWTAFYFVLIKYIKTSNVKWLYVGAVVFALGFLNKYNIVFMTAGLVPAILLTPHRHIFANKHLYFALGLSLLLILPNLIWQYVNGFPVIHHMKELSETQLVNVNKADFFKSQIMFFLGALPVILGGLYGVLFYEPLKKYSLFMWSLIFTLAIFSLFKAKDYYAIGIYPIYVALGAVFLGEYVNTPGKRHLMFSFMLFPLMVFTMMLRISFPNKTPQHMITAKNRYKESGQLRWEDGKDHELPQDYADMLGWKELAEKVERAYADATRSGRTLVLCDNYGQAGAINYYTNNRINAVSFSADYVNWFDLSRPYLNLIRVKGNSGSDGELEKTSPHFANAIVADSIENKYAREYLTRIFVFTGARVDINNRIRSELEKVKF